MSDQLRRARDFAELDYRTAPPEQREAAKLRLIRMNIAVDEQQILAAATSGPIRTDGEIPTPRPRPNKWKRTNG